MTQNNKNSANFGEFMRIFFKNAKRKRSESEAKTKFFSAKRSIANLDSWSSSAQFSEIFYQLSSAHLKLQ
jgi:hypothetical protein